MSPGRSYSRYPNVARFGVSRPGKAANMGLAIHAERCRRKLHTGRLAGAALDARVEVNGGLMSL